MTKCIFYTIESVKKTLSLQPKKEGCVSYTNFTGKYTQYFWEKQVCFIHFPGQSHYLRERKHPSPSLRPYRCPSRFTSKGGNSKEGKSVPKIISKLFTCPIDR